MSAVLSRYDAMALALGSTLFLPETGLAKKADFTIIDVPNAIDTSAAAINAHGDIVGAFVNATGRHGFLLRNGAFTTIDYPGASSTSATGINIDGTITG